MKAVGRLAWMAIGLVAWTVVCMAFAVPGQSVLCPAARPLDPQDPIAECWRQMSAGDAFVISGGGIALFALWLGGVIVAVLLARHQFWHGHGQR